MNHIYIYGKHAALLALSNPRRKIIQVFVTEKTLPLVKKYSSVKVNIVPASFFKNKFKDAIHQEIVLETLIIDQPTIYDFLELNHEKSCVAILDQITDPHNIGAIIRSAAAFSINAVIAAKDHTPQETPIMAKTACGGLELVPYIQVTNIARTIQELQKNGYWCIGLDGSATSNFEISPLTQKIALIIGSEGTGMRRLTIENCDEIMKLPISSQMESLNASNAAAIAFYKWHINT